METRFKDQLRVGECVDKKVIDEVLKHDLFKGRQIAHIRSWIQHANNTKRYIPKEL